MKYLLLFLILLFLASCVGGSPDSAEAGARATLDAAAAGRRSTEQARIDKQLDAQIAAARTRNASDAEIALLREQAKATQNAIDMQDDIARTTEAAASYRRTSAALDRVGTVEAGGMALSATQTYAAATVTAAYIDRKASVGMMVDIVQVLAWCALGIFLVLLGWQLPPALRRYVDRKGSLHDTRYFPVAWVALPDGRVAPQILYLPGGNGGSREPPVINNWTNVQAAPRAPVLQGEIVTSQDVTLEKARQLIRDSIAASGEEGQEVLSWRDAGMSSGRWQQITNLMARAGLVDKTSTGTRTHGDTKLGDVLYTLDVYPGELYAPTPPEDM